MEAIKMNEIKNSMDLSVAYSKQEKIDLLKNIIQNMESLKKPLHAIPIPSKRKEAIQIVDNRIKCLNQIAEDLQKILIE